MQSAPTAQRGITTIEAGNETRKDMIAAILQMLWQGQDPITTEDLQIRHGFTQREIETHGDEARAEARRRFAAARAEG